MIQRLFAISLVFLTLVTNAQDKLILFHNGGDGAADQHFLNEVMPVLAEMATSEGVEVQLASVKQGAPEGVLFTPCIVFQDDYQRSFYVGRYSDVNRVRNFIRTARVKPQPDATLPKSRTIVKSLGRQNLILKLKVTDMTGVLPQGYDQESLRKEAKKWVESALDRFEVEENFEARRTNRVFYLDFHPHLDEAGNFSIATEIYSQFSCIKSVYSNFESPVIKPWKERESGWEAVSKLVQSEVFKQLENVSLGDAFTSIPEETVVKSWEDLGLALQPVLETVQAADIEDLELGTKWITDTAGADKNPMLIFGFLPPVDHYSGQVSYLQGSMQLQPNLALNDVAGEFSFDTRTLTMGDPDLDASVAHKIASDEHSNASFRFKRVVWGGDSPLQFGKTTQAQIEGDLTFMGITSEVAVDSEFEPVIAADGTVRLSVLCGFQLNVAELYGVETPNGPEPQAQTIEFLLRFFLNPQ